MNTSWVDKLYHKQDLWMKKSGYSFISYVNDSVFFSHKFHMKLATKAHNLINLWLTCSRQVR